MAQKKIVQLVDDLDGDTSGQVSTVSFALDDARYEIDLGPANRQRLTDALAPFVAQARTSQRRARAAGGRSTSMAVRTTRADDDDTAAIRAWARQQGHDVKARGRISADLRAAFHAAR